KLSAKTPAAPPAAAAGLAVSQSYAMVTKGPVAPPVPSWGGFYAGAAFGLGSLHTRVGENSHDTSTQTLVTGPPVPGTSTSISVSDSNTAFSGRKIGAIANLFLGYNFVAASNVILGAQVEGGVSNIDVRLNGASTSVFTSTSTGAFGNSISTSV